MEPFTLKLILSFIVGAIWVTGATILAEKYGTKLGGVIVGIGLGIAGMLQKNHRKVFSVLV